MPSSTYASSSRSLRALIWAAVLFLSVFSVACSGTDSSAGGASAGVDVLASDAPVGQLDALSSEVTVPVAGDPYACPGGDLCPCVEDGECDSGFCLELAGQQRCAESCQPECPKGWICKALDKEGEQLLRCVPQSKHLCDPCESSKSCQGFGHADARCVDHGAQGAFCGAACLGDAHCPAGSVCAVTQSVEGVQSLQCVPQAGAGAPAGTTGSCTCSQDAIQKGLKTHCWTDSVKAGVIVGHCMGERVCESGGLSDCDALPPKAEVCNGVDDDCDGLTDDQSCDDGEVCTKDACDPKRGASGKQGCVHTAIEGPCDADGTVCTQGDVCQSGTCVAGKSLKCDDGEVCTQDACDPVLGCTYKALQGKSCEDGDKCTVGDTCQEGACVSGGLKSCDDNKSCTLDGCDDKDGSCKHTLTEGLACDDGDLCTHTDLCDVAGSCVGKAVSCDDGNVCTLDVCGAVKGQGCSHKAQGGQPCDDGDKCTGKGTCVGAVCQGAVPVVCKASGACSTASCDSATGACVDKPSPNGASCDDGDACTEGDKCQSSVCQGSVLSCDDANPCTTDSCDKSEGCLHVSVADLSPCDDGDACTEVDHCASGVCKSQKKVCDDKNPCTVDACDPAEGCTATSVADGQSCDDGDKCTDKDVCKSGQCASGANICTCSKDSECDDQNVCTADTCDLGTKKCVHKVLTGGCDDGDKCTVGDTCKAAAGEVSCVAGVQAKCGDDEVCTEDSCDPKIGCVNTPVTDGKSCDDGDKCTQNDQCSAGKCAGALPTPTVSILAGSTKGHKDAVGKLAAFMQPWGVALDSKTGDVFVADGASHRLRKITEDGTTTTIAGVGVSGFSDGPALYAKLWAPSGLALDADGNLWVADRGNHRIRKLAAKQLTTLAGTAAEPPLGQDPKGGYAEGTGEKALFNLPTALVWSKARGGLVIADQGNHRVRLLGIDGKSALIAGSGTAGFKDGVKASAQFNAPSGLAVDAIGNIYVADRDNQRIRKIALDGTVSTLAGSGIAGYKDGKGAVAQFSKPWGLSLDSVGNLIIADSQSNRLRSLKLNTGSVTTLAGTGTAGSTDGEAIKALFNVPMGVVSDAKGQTFVADSLNARVRLVADPAKVCVSKQSL